MKLGILGLHVARLPKLPCADGRGTALPDIYPHLQDAAGSAAPASRPPAEAERLVAAAAALPPLDLPTAADTPVGTLAADTVGRLLAAAPKLANAVHTVLHCQCTVSEQLLTSSCLQVQHHHFPKVETAVTLGQTGTAGFSTALALAASRIREMEGGRVAITAADRWLAPFLRRYDDVVAYADGAAACVVEAAQPGGEYIAEVWGSSSVAEPLPGNFWTATAEERTEQLVGLACTALRAMFSESGVLPSDIAGVVGETYGRRIGERVATALGKTAMAAPNAPEAMPPHASSAAPFAALGHAIAVTTLRGEPGLYALWSASLSGHGGALLLRCLPSLNREAGTWLPCAAPIRS